MECTTILLKEAIAAGRACAYVKQGCSEYEFVNFFYYRFCVLENQTTFNTILFFVTLVVQT